MSTTLFILNDAPYGSERSYNGLRLAGALAAQAEQHIRVLLIGDAVLGAKAGQKVPAGYYNLELMLGMVLRNGVVCLCGTCMEARDMCDSDVAQGCRRSTMQELAQWTA